MRSDGKIAKCKGMALVVNVRGSRRTAGTEIKSEIAFNGKRGVSVEGRGSLDVSH